MPPETTLIGFAGAPWTLACYMIEGQSTKDFLLTRKPVDFEDAPLLIDSLIDGLDDLSIKKNDVIFIDALIHGPI